TRSHYFQYPHSFHIVLTRSFSTMFSFQLLSTLASAALLLVAILSAATLSLPANQTQLVAPTTAPLFVALGVGVQNYTCTAATLKYACVPTTAFNAWSAAPAGVSPDTVGGKIGAATLLGVRSRCFSIFTRFLNSIQYHYFVPAPSGTGLSPKWDFTSTGKFAGNSTAFILAAKAGDILAPTDSATNVDWLALNNVQGSLASKVFRVDTVNGQPPTSCVAGSADISVKYTAKYYLY
ncbi:hypothetical protein B0H14DRAFT_2843123, partial [Mycena olivaceomarginata]